MKKIMLCLLGTLGLTNACSQQSFENADVKTFAELIENQDVIILDVRTADEFNQGHLENAINIDFKQPDFMEKVKSTLTTDKTIAVYCRSGRRSAAAAQMMATEKYKMVNLQGGILAWKEQNMPIKADLYEVDVFKTASGKTIKLHALTHASIRIQYGSTEIQIDPVSEYNGKKIDYAAMPKADYIFITHEHHDHLDKNAIQTLWQDNTQLFANPSSAKILGFGTVLKNGDKQQIADGLSVEAVPAYNTTKEHLQFHPKGRDNGYILTLDGTRIYIAGDTEDIDEMAKIKDIDIAFLPCNQPYTMTPKQLIKAAKTVRPKVLFPYHYGQTNLQDIPTQLQKEGIDVRIRHYE